MNPARPRLIANVWIISGISGPRMFVISEITKNTRNTRPTIRWFLRTSSLERRRGRKEAADDLANRVAAEDEEQLLAARPSPQIIHVRSARIVGPPLHARQVAGRLLLGGQAQVVHRFEREQLAALHCRR